MSIGQELERLAKLHAEGALTAEEFTQAKGRLLSAPGFSNLAFKGIRRQSARRFCGLPLWAVAVGPDWERGEMRGHARAIFAVGDMATGWFACGGFARGFIAVGGLAVGLVALGGGAVGILGAFGGAAIGGIAIGGGALGVVAIGGGAGGIYALGGGAAGVHTVSAAHQDPAARDFFQQYFAMLTKLLHQ